ncbi:hypothetical protein VTH06DRAFT_1529 [Thermothelomyces fergusii]
MNSYCLLLASAISSFPLLIYEECLAMIWNFSVPRNVSFTSRDSPLCMYNNRRKRERKKRNQTKGKRAPPTRVRERKVLMDRLFASSTGLDTTTTTTTAASSD